MKTLPTTALRRYRRKMNINDVQEKGDIADDTKDTLKKSADSDKSDADDSILLGGGHIPPRISGLPWKKEDAVDDGIISTANDPEFPDNSPAMVELVEACAKHYDQFQVSEKDVIPWFVYNVRNRGMLEALICSELND